MPVDGNRNKTRNLSSAHVMHDMIWGTNADDLE